MIAQLSGVTDVQSLFMIFILTAITMVLGSCHESVNAVARADGYRQNWFPFLAAWIPHLASWSVIFCYFFVGVTRASAPAFVWAIVFILFILDGTFALLFYMQWGKKWIFRNYVNGEIGFIMLSFTSKTLLAWINYVSRPCMLGKLLNAVLTPFYSYVVTRSLEEHKGDLLLYFTVDCL